MTASTTRIALVVGASRGIGYATCNRLAAQGFHVVATSRDQSNLDPLVAHFKSLGHALDPMQLDITDAESIDQVFSEIVSRHGRIDAVVNSAGASYVAPVALANLDRCEDVLRTNLMGSFMVCKAAIRVMTRQRSGRIVMIGSISGTIGASYNAIYAASKAGVGGLVKSVALEVAALGITVNAVQPGTVHTDLFEQTHGARARIKGISLEEQKRFMEEDSPQKRLVFPEEIAEAVAYLVGDAAGAVNGHLLTVDGGRSIA